jgi:hypothetical protein
MRIDLVGTTADFRRFGHPQPLPINHLLCENRRTQGRMGEVGLDAFRKQHEDTIDIQFSAEPPHNLEIVAQTGASMRIPILIGEVCYNLRSALDYLIYELAKLDSGVIQDNTQFLIEDTKDGFERKRKSRLRGVNERHVTCIEEYQPYKGCNWTHALRDLSNPDKHRQFTRIGLTVTGIAYTPADPEFANSLLPIRRTPHPVAGETNVKLDYTATIRFPDGPPVAETLEVIKLKVAETVTAFEAELK